MMHSGKIRVPVIAAAVLVGLASLGSARTAHASSEFPGALQAALQAEFPKDKYAVTFCVPLCTACHTTTLGGPGNLNPFGKNLEGVGGLAFGNGNKDQKVLDAVKKYFAATPAAGGVIDSTGMLAFDSDGDLTSDRDELIQLDSPSIAGAEGKLAFCPDIRYGCGARVAAAPPPVDRVGLFSAGLALLGLAVFRRRFRSQRAR